MIKYGVNFIFLVYSVIYLLYSKCTKPVCKKEKKCCKKQKHNCFLYIYYINTDQSLCKKLKGSRFNNRHRCLLIDLAAGVRLPGVEAFREPHSNFPLSRLNGIRAMADVAANINGEIATNGARGGVRRLGSAEHDTAGLNGSLTLPHDAAHGAGAHIIDKATEESLGRQIGVVIL